MGKFCSSISINEFKQKMFSYDKVTVLDVRQIDEYRQGHIEESILIPLNELPYRLEQLDKNKEIVCVCRSGSRSKEACDMLSNHGFENVSSLSGGLSNWVS